jgi:hypothetical protein
MPGRASHDDAYRRTRIRESAMVLKFIVPVALGAVLLSGATAMAAEYRPDEFLTLDLSKAVLSPKPLGPEAHFQSVPVEAKADPKADQTADQKTDQATAGKPDQAVAAAQPEASPKLPRRMATPRVHLARPLDKSHRPARTRLAHRHGNPLDAQAMDTRIQTWPCRPGTGGICNWR